MMLLYDLCVIEEYNEKKVYWRNETKHKTSKSMRYSFQFSLVRGVSYRPQIDVFKSSFLIHNT